ncbi:MAG TPA: class I SAM-dependent methyltransferase [Thermoanaerobaculia bacterium]|jgi:trans-aconitate methyltransferase|nr:class I SAM-dependent methyltransferase [Thermoanaerobaculia bacterium]
MTNPPDKTWTGADAYEAFMGRWSRPLALKFVDWLQPAPAAHWLEVGCGTGALTAAICDRCEPASVVACDPSASFLEHARSRVPDDRVSFVVAGAEALPHRERGFDAVVSGLVLNFLPDPGQVAAAIRERLRPGGLFAAYVWDYADGMEFLRAFWEEAIAADPQAASRAENLGFPLCRPPALVSLLETAGFGQVQIGSPEIPTDLADFDDYWQPFLRGTGTGPSFVTTLDKPSRERLRVRLQRRLEPGSDGHIRLNARAWAVRGLAS